MKILNPLSAKGPSYTMQAKGRAGEIYVYDVIGDRFDGTTAKSFAADLKALGAVDTLDIFINSPGGSVFDGVAMLNILNRHRARKTVKIDGMAASIASVLAMAGDDIQIAENAMMMVHDPWAVGIGDAADMRKLADMLDKVRDSILGTYVARSGTAAETLSGMMEAETWLTAEEAVEVGLADTVVEPVAMAACFDLSPFNNVPEAFLKPFEAVPHPAIAEARERVARLRA